MYECVLNISFPDDLDSIFKAIQIRHDIVHRNGKAKDGTPVKIDDANVLNLIAEVESFVEGINKQLPARKNF